MGGRIITLPSVLHIPKLAKNSIYVRNMSNAGVKIVFEKDTNRMVIGEMVSLRGVHVINFYNLFRSTISVGCNSSIVLESGA